MSWSTIPTRAIRPAAAATPAWQGWRFAVKHTFDRVVAVLALLVLAPLLLVIALAVRLSSPGTVLFRQRRVGRGGEVFDVYKFRSMRDRPSESSFEPVDGIAPGGVEGTDRRTRVGRWLRASSLDELPQLLNVLRGEMSLVGPRPERPEFAARFASDIPGYANRHRVRCGITGWAQANGLRGQTPISERAAHDNYYIDHWSVRLELLTIVLTVVEVLRFREARGAAKRPAEVPACAG
jgi:lipopolysaccharide/colanic/teichoic acid biosynthesis glycosyltransferase